MDMETTSDVEVAAGSMSVEVVTGLVSGVGVIVVHAESNKINTSCEILFIIRLYSLSECGHSHHDHAHICDLPIN
jgi:hypothetical protein